VIWFVIAVVGAGLVVAAGRVMLQKILDVLDDDLNDV